MGSLAIARLSVIETLRRKEFYILLVLVFFLAVWMQLANPGASGVGRFAKDIVMQIIWLASFGLAVPLAARQITADVEQKTIYVLMARPIHRWQYVFGRALGASTASVVCFTSMFIVLAMMLFAKGMGSLVDVSLWQSYVLQVIALVMLSSIAIFFSTFSTTAASVTYSLMALALMRYGGPSIMHQIEAMSGSTRDILWVWFVTMPHFEFFNISQRVVHEWGAMPWKLFAGVAGYGIAYAIFMTAFASVIFKRRWL